ncbi:MAG TPA: NAD(P)/FAD-dependent oxidoreductase [Solirubrobacteraceae bacterium]|nr:NAD(P)/FAD-dependent oxidoreductase [Solirubrobacteraceae bacterium]
MQNLTRESLIGDPPPKLGPDGGCPPKVVIVGAGPGGLTAAFQLQKHGLSSVVLEASSHVGGISRTEQRDGFRFDIGPHRFFTKVKAIEDLWHEILPGEDFMLRPRQTRIYYAGKYFDYPINAKNALRNMGVVEATRCVASYIWAQLRLPRNQESYEGWLIARFGSRLYRTFFKTYTEKVWGVPVSAMPADWAAQRVKSLSLGKALLNALTPKRNQKEITSLIEEFKYPKYGAGMMWELCHDAVSKLGTEVVMSAEVVSCLHAAGRATSVITRQPDGSNGSYQFDELISSMPISELIKAMYPATPDEIVAAASDLRYRDHLTIALVVPADKVPWHDNWIYVHDPNVRTMRILNVGAWSPHMVKNGRNVLGLEYTLFEGDPFWDLDDEALIECGKQELNGLDLVRYGDIGQGYVVRTRKAYPVYDDRYHHNIQVIREWLRDNVRNVHPIGRNGMFRYNNQDHSMYTAMLTVENIVTGTSHDVWSVNVEQEYHEHIEDASVKASSGTGRDAPQLPRAAVDESVTARQAIN